MTGRIQNTLKIIRDRRVECPICKAGWPITKATNLQVLADAVEAHMREHKRIKAEKPSEKDESKPRRVALE
jgi:hypothetical protein